MRDTPPPVVYVDRSAMGALLIDQPESSVLLDWLDQSSATPVSNDLLETELRRLAVREGLDQSDVTRVLDGVALAALDRAVYRSSGFLPMPYLRTLDALHLEAAIRLDVSAILTLTAGSVRRPDLQDSMSSRPGWRGHPPLGALTEARYPLRGRRRRRAHTPVAWRAPHGGA